MSSKIPTGNYYAIRKGGKHGLCRAIIFDYQNALPFLPDNDNDGDGEAERQGCECEYHVFDTIEEASAYLQEEMPLSTTTTTTTTTTVAPFQEAQEAPLNAQMLASIAAVMQESSNKDHRVAGHDDVVVDDVDAVVQGVGVGGDPSSSSLLLAPPAPPQQTEQQQPPPTKKRRTAESSAAASASATATLAFASPPPYALAADGGTAQQHRAPTKKWEENFALLKASLETNRERNNGGDGEVEGDGGEGSLQAASAEAEADKDRLEKWVKDQKYMYKLYQEGKVSSMTADKIKRLRDIGVELPHVECLASSSTSVLTTSTATADQKLPSRLLLETTSSHKEKRGIYKRWYDQFEALKAYMATHDGSYDIPKDDQDHAKLKSWIDTQQHEYKKYVTNRQESNMNAEKVRLLRSIGFQFTYVSFDEHLQQLRAYLRQQQRYQQQLQQQQQQDGTTDTTSPPVLTAAAAAGPPQPDKDLIKWMVSMKRQCKIFLESGEPTRDLNAGRYTQIMAIVGGRWDNVSSLLGSGSNNSAFSSTTTAVQDEATKWDTMYGRLVEYKRLHGDVNGMKRTPETRELCNWIVTQRNEYKKLQQSKPSKMTASRLIRFNDVGLLFSKRGNYKSFEERLEQLKEYKAQHGNLDIPISHPELGEFVGRQRAHYNKMMAGEKCSMTPDRVSALQAIGFAFDVAGGRPKRNRVATNKTWDERFAEVQAFRQEFGHALVPQHSQFTPGLGAWVKDQRKHYKHMLAGKKSPMTAEKALKLTSIGFVWDCFERSKRRRRGEMMEDI